MNFLARVNRLMNQRNLIVVLIVLLLCVLFIPRNSYQSIQHDGGIIGPNDGGSISDAVRKANRFFDLINPIVEKDVGPAADTVNEVIQQLKKNGCVEINIKIQVPSAKEEASMNKDIWTDHLIR